MRYGLMGTAMLMATALSGCAMQTSEGGQAVPPPAAITALSCNVSRAEGFVGKPGDAVAEEARIAAGARLVRVIRPGTQVTMDYRGDRLNLKVGEKGMINGVSCG